MPVTRRTVMATAACGLSAFAAAPAWSMAPFARDLFATRLPVPLAHGLLTASDGEKIAWSRFGTGDVAVILIHGAMCDQSYWFAQIAALAKRYRVVTLDLPGHGGSSIMRRNWTMPAFASDVARVVRHGAGGRPAYLVGHSMGGVVAALTTAMLPETIGLSAIDIFTTARPPAVPLASVATGPAYVAEARIAIRRGMFAPRSDAATADLIAQALAGAPQAIAASVRGATQAVVGAPALAAMSASVPLSLINSDRHPYNLAELRSVHTLTDGVIVDDVGHFVMIDAPDAVNALLIRTIEHTQLSNIRAF